MTGHNNELQQALYGSWGCPACALEGDDTLTLSVKDRLEGMARHLCMVGPMHDSEVGRITSEVADLLEGGSVDSTEDWVLPVRVELGIRAKLRKMKEDDDARSRRGREREEAA